MQTLAQLLLQLSTLPGLQGYRTYLVGGALVLSSLVTLMGGDPSAVPTFDNPTSGISPMETLQNGLIGAGMMTLRSGMKNGN